jgi:hypothetical protein
LKAQQTFVIICVAAVLIVAIHSRSQTPSNGLQVLPASIDFGQDPVSSDSPAHTITITNPTKSPIAIQQIIASGIDFSEKNNCGNMLEPGAQCTIQVSFTPAITGPRTGNLQIVGSDGAPHFVALNGDGK